MTLPPFLNLASAQNSLGAVIAVTCDLVRGTEAKVMDALLPRVRQESVALDLSGVQRMDAAGIATLIALYCTSVEAGNEFHIVAPSPHVLEMLRIVGLESILVAENGLAGAMRAKSDRLRGCECSQNRAGMSLTAA
jgi:anti-anti-sigma factor